jgi:hypothetical protein
VRGFRGTDTRSKLRAHVDTHKDKGERDFRFTCKELDCRFRCNKRNDLRRHEETHKDKGERDFEFTCVELDCRFRTNRGSHWLAHVETHKHKEQRDYGYPCTSMDCGYTAITASKLRRHMQCHAAVTILPFPCRFCGRRSTFKCNRDQHEKICQHKQEAATVQPGAAAEAEV